MLFQLLQVLLHQLVSSYLVHHGFSSTAEGFTRSTGQTIPEDLASVKNRQVIQKLVLVGKIGEAIAVTERLYPDLLRDNPNLNFMLRISRMYVLEASVKIHSGSCNASVWQPTSSGYSGTVVSLQDMVFAFSTPAWDYGGGW